MTRRRSFPSADPRLRVTVGANVAGLARSTVDQVTRPCKRPVRKAASTEPSVETWAVVDNWPGAVPVTAAEVEALEIYVGDLIDELLGGTGHDR